jgi:ribosome-associated toxin RatA of RatAB toxin-antitoxin module
MALIDRSALLPYSPAQVYELVNDIECYPQFMDGCVGAEILRREPDLIEARLDLARGGLSQSFTTINRLVPNEAIFLRLREGPFEQFEGAWHFQALGDAACKVSLKLQFTFSNSVLGAAAARLFDGVTNSLVDAVVRRARQVYG